MKKTHICLWMSGNSNWMGGSLYTQNLVRAISCLPVEERSKIKLSVACLSSQLTLLEPVLPEIDKVYISGKIYLKICHALAQRLIFIPSQTFNPLEIDFLYPTYVGTKSPYQWGAWIPDFQHHYFPDFFSEQEIKRRNIIHKKMANNASVVILSSKMAQSDFHNLYPEAASRTKVMNFVSYLKPEFFASNPQSVQKEYKLPDRFFIVSNQFWKHKNHILVIEALGILKQKNIYPTIAFTGKFNKEDEYFRQILSRIEELNLGNQVRILGLIPRLEQIQLMRQSLAIIQPSLFEGWSTVIEDARALGKSILASDFPVHIEQNPPNTHYFERHNPEQLALLISEAFDNWQSGVNIENENATRKQIHCETIAYGRKFLEIVKNTIDK